MAYIDKTFWHDSSSREVPLLNHEEGYKDTWDLDMLTLRWRYSDTQDEKVVSIEIHQHKGELVELLLTREQALRLAHKLEMSVAELTTEKQTEHILERLERAEVKLDLLEFGGVLEQAREEVRKCKFKSKK